jgi:Fe2+ or Zn2+ uptake regulation protein
MQTDLFNPPQYFRTTAPTATQHAARSAKATGQNVLILSFFQERSSEDFTAWEVSRHFIQWPITSIRRSLHTLEKEGKVVRTGRQRDGGYGVENFTYQYRSNGI